MFSRMIKLFSPTSIVSKVTLWYTLFISVLVLIMFAVSLTVSGSWVDYLNRNELELKTTELASDLDEFEAFDDGIYFVVYNDQKELEKGFLPKGFDEVAPFKTDTLSSYQASQSQFYYFDVYNAKAQKWVRGIRSTSGLNKELGLILVSLAIFAPISIMIMAIGGRRILRRAFLPIEEVTQLAEEITDSRDYDRRVSSKDSQANSETSRLVNVFNRMLSSVQASFEKEKQFNQNVSHELRTPLSVILAESEFGEKYAESIEDHKESLAVINRQAKLMKNMTEQILELSKTQQIQEANFVVLSLSELVSHYCKEQEKKWSDLAITFDISIASDVWILGDKILLLRVLDNLVSNAVKFTKTRVSISVKMHQDKVILAVADDGIGIPDEHQESIWDRFYQVETSRNKAVHTGVGLGLSFVKEIAERHKADVAVLSNKDEGSTFSVSFLKMENTSR
ncbi:HAMP domain-containing sensor histidine kinase [Streptococcus hyovaginalis]|uniref:sensor histidine kinase n=1 Tax=Streptococcus hyovaginalis TaxID=149015 RepID=UPI002A7C9543|nr:HAMP domain-containing sensor histidine kinase [Streptococcus hyovaginalis]MDY3023956.1 HAMP domain-containing sensor histidine kinase [Streptococcus hyovaginalis]MDY4511033.1 HAMP domain-containing sensor histidine kinase [Streptococcus hyovaginalis]